jgi:hypothetical protein
LVPVHALADLRVFESGLLFEIYDAYFQYPEIFVPENLCREEIFAAAHPDSSPLLGGGLVVDRPDELVVAKEDVRDLPKPKIAVFPEILDNALQRAKPVVRKDRDRDLKGFLILFLDMGDVSSDIE